MVNAASGGFLLTRDWRDGKAGLQFDLWLHTPQGPVNLRIADQEAVCFFDRQQLARLEQALAGETGWRQQPLALTSHTNRPVNGLYCRRQADLRRLVALAEAAGVPLWETDIRPVDRYLMERFITADLQYQTLSQQRRHTLAQQLRPVAPQPLALRVLSLDIETSMDASRLFSIGLYGEHLRRVYMVGARDSDDGELEIVGAGTERECLDKFLRALRLLDPDVIIGWNLVGFDLWVLQQLCDKHGLKFSLGRDGQAPRWRQEEGESGRRFVQLAGRVPLDGIDLLKAAFYQYESFSLQHVSEQLLGDAKLLSGHRGEQIAELFATDKPALARYNLQDCKLVWDIFARTRLLDFAVARARLTGLPLDRIGGSVAAFEYAYLPLLHRAGFVAPNLGELQSDVVSPGGYVMDSAPGFYQEVLVLDFKSLYPSIIRTFLIDPCGFWLARNGKLKKADRVPGFNGAHFARQGHLLPGIIEKLWTARDQAKRAGDQPLSQAIKIIMNSFYGVLGSEGCRFFDPRVCSSITLRGHEIIQRSRQWIEQQGFAVIYGDTDSLFVWVRNAGQAQDPQAIGAQLAAGLNQWWRDQLAATFDLASALEIQFETRFEKFFMPTIRGSELGSKKRYAGQVRINGERQLVFKGLETVRTDWTRLARDFQVGLYQRLFDGEPVAQWISAQVLDLRAGQCDDRLVYRKRLRRPLADYRKSRPPHVQAALKLAAQGQSPKRGDWVEYLMTVNGPEPLSQLQSPVDYDHYLERQLAPIADAILPVFGASFQSLVMDQLSLW